MTSRAALDDGHALIVGAGVAGLTTALALTAAGWRVTLIAGEDRGCSWQGGGMLAPICELDHAESFIVDAGLDAVDRWRSLLGDASDVMMAEGSILVAHRPEWPLLSQLADRVRRSGQAHRLHALDHAALKAREPALAHKFRRGWWVEGEGVVHPRRLLPALRARAQALGVAIVDAQASDVTANAVSTPEDTLSADVVIDARGLAARDDVPLRGVRGEFAIVHAPDVQIIRPVRLMHPRYPLYIVPRPEGRYYLGATQLERDDDRPATVRSALELLSALYSVHPAFGDAEVEEFGVGLRPATPDHAPCLIVRDGLLRLNGLFRHGFLLAPRMAQAVVDVLAKRPVGDDVAAFVQEAA